MAELAFNDPPQWSIPGQEPLNTRPDDPDNGARYKPIWNPILPVREITAEANSTGQAGFNVAYADRAKFEKDALGYTTYTEGNKHLTRRLPLRHGGLNDPTLFCRLVREEIHADSTGEGKKVFGEDDPAEQQGWAAMPQTLYRGYFIQANYDLLDDETVEGEDVPELLRYLVRTFTDEQYHRRVASWQFVYEDETTKIAPVLGSLPEHVQRWKYVSLRWPWNNGEGCPLPIGALAATGGKVNADVFDPAVTIQLPGGSVQNGFPAETLLQEHYELSPPYRGADSNLYVDLIVYFLYFQPTDTATWNKVWKGGSVNDYVGVHEKGYPSNKPYRTADFNRIFLPRGAP